ncbi:uncharacterized protein MELLADRAFT_96341 [Melampsora larici-populina 98AG31]|uniref:Uncharacterized protein n=1 Tax=Melampsora larici-populina (strain 98AG31 / pathotype 3-4-7) TaxID=747676 RepID=F4REF3_MELLP|nr:uncharacterized protein MELLADRAFT_96341 [Melampsora larici-populina 98AG31]EGG09279.1 hypothetical protein MELLADRAFT_96341 [Melampsora larici-populina 98AG31]
MASITFNQQRRFKIWRFWFGAALLFTACWIFLVEILRDENGDGLSITPKPSSIYKISDTYPNPLDHNNWRMLIAVDPTASKPSPEYHQSTRTQKIFSYLSSYQTQAEKCRDLWISEQTLCTDEQFRSAVIASQSSPSLDVVWTWVNGSDPVFSKVQKTHERLRDSNRSASASTKEKETVFQVGTDATHFADHDELRYSLRSALGTLKSIRTFNIFTVDFSSADLRLAEVDIGPSQPSESSNRWGSVPSWLNQTALDGTPNPTIDQPPIRVIHHSEAQNEKFADSPLSFSSLAIESRIPRLNVLRDNVLYANDDCFLLRKLETSDLETILTGPILHIQMSLSVTSHNPWLLSNSKPEEVGEEWVALKYTSGVKAYNRLNSVLGASVGNWLLDARFGARDRCYLGHYARMLSIPISRELSLVWEKEFIQTDQAKFRALGPEVYLFYLHAWYTIEKHRESLLYSFVMLKTDSNVDGIINQEEYDKMLHHLSIEGSQTVIKTAAKANSSSVPKVFDALDQLHIPLPLETEYHWTASDGYALSFNKSCEISIDECLEYKPDTPSVELFRRIAFEKVQCGDCLIQYLIDQNGLNALLPPVEPEFFNAKLSPPWSHTDLNGPESDWRNGSFKVNLTMVQKIGKRKMALRQLERYNYVIGSSNSTFATIRRPGDVHVQLSPLQNESHPATYLAINDQVRAPRFLFPVQNLLHNFFKNRFSDSIGWWEKSG